MKKLFAFFALSTMFIFTNSFAEHSYKEITPQELVQMKKDNTKLVIIDSRGGDWFDGEVIEGGTQLDPAETNADTLAKIAPDKTQAIVFYCQNLQCPASAKAAEKAAAAGYTNLYKLPEGIEGWKKLGLPTSKIEKKS